LFQKEKEYLQSLPSAEVIESYLSYDRQTTVRKDSMVTFMKSKYSVPAEYIEKPVRLCINNDKLEIYYSTDLIFCKKYLNYFAMQTNACKKCVSELKCKRFICLP
jgi:hypothetical protein